METFANFSVALRMTLIGMGLVFVSLLLLWGAMALLLRLSTQREKQEPVEETRAVDIAARQARLRRVAVAAVALALARQTVDELHEFPLPPTSIVSAWQAVMRSSTLNRRGPNR
jgi:Na+-transporting methylmalonyl-CoA/oxaloacetate decarboxylase gamma subunit